MKREWVESQYGAMMCEDRYTSYMRLFLYVSNEALDSIIKKPRIRISEVFRTNDATEGVPQNKVYRPEIVKKTGYVCLSAVADSPAMWGYYADSSRGACLAFDFSVHCRNGKEYAVLKNGIEYFLPDKKWIRPVTYQKERAKSGSTAWDEENFELMCIKSSDWSHEKEYRIFYWLDYVDAEQKEYDEKGILRYYDNSFLLQHLSGIILGVHSPRTIDEVNKLMQKSGCDYFDSLPVIKASYHATDFPYYLNLDAIPLRQGGHLADFWPLFQTANWSRHIINTIIPLRCSDYRWSYDRSIICSVRLNDKIRKFVIAPREIMDENEELIHTGEYDMFEYTFDGCSRYHPIYGLQQKDMCEVYLQATKKIETILGLIEGW